MALPHLPCRVPNIDIIPISTYQVIKKENYIMQEVLPTYLLVKLSSTSKGTVIVYLGESYLLQGFRLFMATWIIHLAI